MIESFLSMSVFGVQMSSVLICVSLPVVALYAAWIFRMESKARHQKDRPHDQA